VDAHDQRGPGETGKRRQPVASASASARTPTPDVVRDEIAKACHLRDHGVPTDEESPREKAAS
jgi:hypothetical protein